VYAHWYSRIHGAVDVEQSPRAGFVSALSAAVAATGRWQTGWVALESFPDGRCIAGRGKLTRLVRSGDYANVARPGVPVEPGDGLAVLDRLDWLDESTGFWGARSLDEEPPLPHKRVYWSVDWTRIARVLRELIPVLESVGKPWSLKCPSEPLHFARVDALVVYLARSHWPQFEPVIGTLAKELAPQLRHAVPPLTQPISRGVTCADSPVRDVSFGQVCCQALASGVRNLLDSERRELHVDLQALKQGLVQHGIDPNQPWVCD
jgi:hypothetical protein